MRAAILGGADCVWEDFRRLEDMVGGHWAYTTIAVNDAACHVPPWRCECGRCQEAWDTDLGPRTLDAIVTLHPEKLYDVDPESGDGGRWLERRRKNGHDDGCQLWANRAKDLVHHVIKHWGGGSSGLLAVAVAYEMGADQVVLCGVPMTERPHFPESEEHDGEGDWVHADSHWRAWKRKLRRDDHRSRYLQENVRSMSGRTREVLGAPDFSWLSS